MRFQFHLCILLLRYTEEDSGNCSDSGVGSSSDDDDGICFPHLKRLMFDGNPISSWDEIVKLGELCRKNFFSINYNIKYEILMNKM